MTTTTPLAAGEFAARIPLSQQTPATATLLHRVVPPADPEGPARVAVAAFQSSV